jgi:hypothetical protein
MEFPDDAWMILCESARQAAPLKRFSFDRLRPSIPTSSVGLSENIVSVTKKAQKNPMPQSRAYIAMIIEPISLKVDIPSEQFRKSLDRFRYHGMVIETPILAWRAREMWSMLSFVKVRLTISMRYGRVWRLSVIVVQTVLSKSAISIGLVTDRSTGIFL